MSAKLQNSPTSWIDPDDAPELTEDFFEHGEWKIGDQPVSAQEGATLLRKALSSDAPEAENTQLTLTMRYDAEVIDAFKATGNGWQLRMNTALRDWLKTHSLPHNIP
jgi:uncharacterized protein (DUF4415 family)